ncbi:MAG TPA: hypothetical protein VIQ31_02865 [Phormidium sp.]
MTNQNDQQSSLVTPVEYLKGTIRNRKLELLEEAEDLIKHLEYVKQYINDTLDDPEVCPVSLYGEVQGRGGKLDAKCGELAGMVRSLKVITQKN